MRVELSVAAGWLGAADPAAARVAGRVLLEGRQGAVPLQASLEALGAQVEVGVGASRLWLDVDALAGTEAEAVALAWGALAEMALPARAVRLAAREARADRRTLSRAPGAVHEAAVARAVYPSDHPLGAREPASWLRGLGRARVRGAARALLGQGAPAVVVVGDTTADAILPVLEAAWPGLGGRETPGILAAPPRVGPRLVLVDDPGAASARITVSSPAPGAFTADLAVVELVNECFGGGFSSRLNARLREELGLAYGAFSRVRAWPGHGRLLVDAVVAVGSLPAALEEIDAVRRGMVESPPAGAELEAARRGLLRDEAVNRGTAAGVAYELGLLVTWGEDPAWRAEHAARRAAATEADVAAAARALLDTDDVVIVVSADAWAALDALDAAGRAPDAIWSADWVIDGP